MANKDIYKNAYVATGKVQTNNNKKANTSTSAIGMSKQTYDKYDKEFKYFQKTGKYSNNFTGFNNQQELNLYKQIKGNKGKNAYSNGFYYHLDDDVYDKYGREYNSWSNTGKYSDGFEFDAPTLETFKNIRRNRSAYDNGFDDFRYSLDDNVVKRLQDKYKSQWGDKYYYTMTDPEDVARQAQGLMPKYLERQYNMDDSYDSWLYENNLPYMKKNLFSDMYSDAYHDWGEEQTKRSGYLDNIIGKMDTYDTQKANYIKGIAEGKTPEELLATGQFDNLNSYYRNPSEPKNPNLAYQQEIGKKDYSIFDKAYEDIRNGKQPDEEFWKNYTDSKWNSYLAQKYAWNESDIDSAMGITKEQREVKKKQESYQTNFIDVYKKYWDEREEYFRRLDKGERPEDILATGDFDVFNKFYSTEKKSSDPNKARQNQQEESYFKIFDSAFEDLQSGKEPSEEFWNEYDESKLEKWMASRLKWTKDSVYEDKSKARIESRDNGTLDISNPTYFTRMQREAQNPYMDIIGNPEAEQPVSQTVANNDVVGAVVNGTTSNVVPPIGAQPSAPSTTVTSNVISPIGVEQEAPIRREQAIADYEAKSQEYKDGKITWEELRPYYESQRIELPSIQDYERNIDADKLSETDRLYARVYYYQNALDLAEEDLKFYSRHDGEAWDKANEAYQNALVKKSQAIKDYNFSRYLSIDVKGIEANIDGKNRTIYELQKQEDSLRDGNEIKIIDEKMRDLMRMYEGNPQFYQPHDGFQTWQDEYNYLAKQKDGITAQADAIAQKIFDISNTETYNYLDYSMAKAAQDVESIVRSTPQTDKTTFFGYGDPNLDFVADKAGQKFNDAPSNWNRSDLMRYYALSGQVDDVSLLNFGLFNKDEENEIRGSINRIQYATAQEIGTLNYLAMTDTDACKEYAVSLDAVLADRKNTDVSLVVEEAAKRFGSGLELPASVAKFLSPYEGFKYARDINNGVNPAIAKSNAPLLTVSKEIPKAVSQDISKKYTEPFLGGAFGDFTVGDALNQAIGIERGIDDILLRLPLGSAGAMWMSGTVLGSSMMDYIDSGADLSTATSLSAINVAADYVAKNVSFETLRGILTSRDTAKGFVKHLLNGLKQGASGYATSYISGFVNKVAEALNGWSGTQYALKFKQLQTEHPDWDEHRINREILFVETAKDSIPSFATGFIVGAAGSALRSAYSKERSQGTQTESTTGNEILDIGSQPTEEPTQTTDIGTYTGGQLVNIVEAITCSGLDQDTQNNLLALYTDIQQHPEVFTTPEGRNLLSVAENALTNMYLCEQEKQAKAEAEKSKAESVEQKSLAKIENKYQQGIQLKESGDVAGARAVFSEVYGMLEEHKELQYNNEQKLKIDYIHEEIAKNNLEQKARKILTDTAEGYAGLKDSMLVESPADSLKEIDFDSALQKALDIGDRDWYNGIVSLQDAINRGNVDDMAKFVAENNDLVNSLAEFMPKTSVADENAVDGLRKADTEQTQQPLNTEFANAQGEQYVDNRQNGQSAEGISVPSLQGRQTDSVGVGTEYGETEGQDKSRVQGEVLQEVRGTSKVNGWTEQQRNGLRKVESDFRNSRGIINDGDLFSIEPNEVNESQHRNVNLAESVTSIDETHYFGCKSDTNIFGYTPEDKSYSAVRSLDGDPIEIFHKGHEDTHRRKDVQNVLDSVVKLLGEDKGLGAFNAYLESIGQNPVSSMAQYSRHPYKEEFLCDIGGAYVIFTCAEQDGEIAQRLQELGLDGTRIFEALGIDANDAAEFVAFAQAAYNARTDSDSNENGSNKFSKNSPSTYQDINLQISEIENSPEYQDAFQKALEGDMDYFQNFAKEKGLDSLYSQLNQSSFSNNAEIDNRYNKAVESGNVAEQQAIVDEQAKKNGWELKHWYHGTPNDFRSFKHRGSSGSNGSVYGEGFYLASDINDANRYGNNVIDAYVKYNKDKTLSVDNLTISKEDFSKFVNAAYDWQNSDNGLIWSGNDIYVEHELNDFDNYDSDRKLIEGFMHGIATNDSEVLKNLYGILRDTTGYDAYGDAPYLVVFNADQIKRADPVTYDGNGNIVPVSQRFSSSNDINFSTNKPNDMYFSTNPLARFDTGRQQTVEDYSREEKKNATAQQRAMRDGTVERIKLANQRRENQENITENAKSLAKMVTNPDFKTGKYVPASMIDTVVEIADLVDLGSTNKVGRDWGKTLDNLHNILANIENGTDEEYYGSLSIMEGAIDSIRGLSQSLEGVTSVKQMTAEQSRDLNNLLKMTIKAVKMVNKFHYNNRNIELSKVAERSVSKIESESRAMRTNSDFVNKILSAALYDCSDYYSFAQRTGLEDELKPLSDGYQKTMGAIKKFSDYVHDDLYKKNGITGSDIAKMSNDRHEFKMEDGSTATCSTAQLMCLYATAGREQGYIHLMNPSGGFIFKGENVKKNHLPAEGELDKMFAELTDKQKDIALDLVEYMSNDVGKMLNSITQEEYGIDCYTEKNYIPLSTDPYSRNPRNKDENDSAKSLTNSFQNASFTNALNKRSNNGLVIDDIFQVFTDHLTDAANYYGMSIPMSDILRWFNYKPLSADGKRRDSERSVWKTIDNTYGKGASRFLVNFLKDLNHESKSGRKLELANTLIRNTKRTAIAGSARVTLQQPTAIVRAMADINPKFFIGISNITNLKGEIEEMQEHSNLAWWKSNGMFDINTGKSMRGILFNDETGLDKFTNWTMQPAGFADDFGWVQIWDAVKRETKAHHKELVVGSDEFFDYVDKRFCDVINRTQVIDTPFHRPQVMRSKDSLTGQYTAFMSEPMRQINQFVNAACDVYQKKSGSMQRLVKTSLALLASYAVNAAVVSAFDALRWRKRGEDVWDTIEGNFVDEFTDNVNPLTHIPYIKDIWALLNGESSDRMDMSAIGDIIDNVRRLTKYMADPEASDWTAYGVYSNVCKSICSLLGIPLNGLLNSGEALVNSVFPQTLAKRKPKSNEEKAYSLMDEGLNERNVFYLLVGTDHKPKYYNAKSAGTQALSIVTADTNGDGKPDFTEEEQDKIAEILGMTGYTKHRDKYANLEEYGIESANKYIKDHEGTNIFDTYFEILGKK